MSPLGYAILRFAVIAGVGALFFAIGYRWGDPAPESSDEEPRASRLAQVLALLGLAGVLANVIDPRYQVDRSLPLPNGLLRDLCYAPGALLIGVALRFVPRLPTQPPAGASKEALAGYARLRSRRLAIAFLGLAYALFLLHDPLYVLAKAPSNLSPGERGKHGVVVLQRNGVNCVPASAASVLALWGAEHHDGELALRSSTSYYGTPEHRIVAAIEALHPELQALRLSTSWDELRALDHPCLLGVKLSRVISHCVALLGLEPEHAILGEPLETGLQRFELALLPGIKPWGGRAIVIGRDFRYEVASGERHPVVARLRREARAAGRWQEEDPADPALLDGDLLRCLGEVARGRGLSLPEPLRLTPKLILACNAELQRGQIPSLREGARALAPLLRPGGVAAVGSAGIGAAASGE